ncbi:zinc ribbon domain-containing protein [Candidatus Methylospira mobilis]|uniref:Zinc ribbon domain-containing protein n=1 Tax=Candidatus Methylospira mobilis TaxID=1808979 RepID=A0A5Q0BKK9_9GAMM|nr:zinc ribbon domain-containing protein [Candidatus Methylospira mobilis]QFY42657.1 zinc ribbon domain-containing protein [Candidatus Methylospira mobilis]
MPIYEYRCTACGHELEVIQKVSDSPLEVCPACGAKTMTKLVSAAGFRLKGGGWYETDFKSGSDKKRNLAGEAKTDAPAKTESKPSSGTPAV